MSIQHGQLCNTVVPSMQILANNLQANTSSLPGLITEILIGDPSSYNLQSNWSSAFTQMLGIDTSSLKPLNITSPGVITTLSTLMVKLSSCIKFDRHRGYNTTEEMDAAAQELAIERELYASVIFKFSNDSSKRRKATSSPSFSGSSLPPKVGYTIRMHMDNVMRTDRVRRPYFVKDTYITAGGTMRYNRGFIYLQENIDRAIIETQTGQKIEDIAVQLQPFPYPCFLRDEFLEAMFFVFPLMLMIQWMLFVADFVKKLVFLVSSFFDKTYIAGLSGSLLYVLCFFPFIVVMALEGNLNFFQKSALSLFSPTCFSYACQYATRYEAQGEGIQWSNSYTSPISGDTASFGWLCWLLFIDSILYFFIGGYIRMVFPGKYGIPAPWYFPFQLSFWTNLFSNNGSRGSKGLLFSNIMKNQPVLSEGKGKGKSTLAHQTEVYGKDMQTNIDKVRRELGVCMQYDVLFDHMTTKEHLLLYGQIKAPNWSCKELHEQVRTILEETGMYAHRHKRVGTLSGGMKRKLSISIAFIGGSRLLGGYGISDTTLEEVFLHLTNETTDAEDKPLSISETLSDTGSINIFSFRRDWKGLISQVLLPVLFVMVAMGLGSIKSDMQHYPEMELSPALYKFSPSYSFFSNQNGNSSDLVDSMMSFPGIDNACLDKFNDQVCTSNTNNWIAQGNISKPFSVCKCTQKEQICSKDNFQPPHKKIPSSQIVYNLSGINVENYLVATANDFIRNRYGGFAFGMPLPIDLQVDVTKVPQNRTLAKVWFNPEGHHTMPAYLNSLNNFILRSKIPADKDPQQYAISVSSHPYFGRMDDEDTVVKGLLQILVAMCVLTGFSITTSSFALYEVNEHQSGSKRLQHIAGISEAFYWSVNFFYDMVTYLIPVTLTICVIAAFQIPAFTDRQNLGAIALLLVLFGFSTFPWMYLLSGVFRDGEIAFISYVCINLFISINTIMSTSILYFLGQIARQNPEFIQEIFRKLCNAFLIFPQFNFGNGMMILARTNIEVQILSGYGIDAYKNPFSTDGLGWMFISSFIQGCFFFILRLVLNKSLMRKVRHLILGRKTVPQVAPEQEDEDVSTEHLRVASGAASSDLLQINQLTKVYQHLNKKVHAVKRLSVGIPAGECFGLLGVNGAGKTTTFKMLTGDVSPTAGSARIMDRDRRLVDIMECRYKGINIGYCPQVDALDDLLTGEEHLYFYARIRGISKREIDGVVNYLLKRLELNYHRNIVTDGYSCGTRRKLSAALALIGHPQILLLDEPSSGMDPRTKRHLWKIISEEVRGKCAVVLTSHSMEECEALCSRLAIMVKGHFQCLGSLQHIKNRFGTGFTVKMYLTEPACDAEAITTFMQHRFPSTYLKDQHSAMVEYHVPNAPGGVADIFNQLETNKNALCIKHFSVSQTTLDEVFINFAMGNIGTDTESTHSEEDDDDDGLDSIKAVQT
uniref:ATP-binding cassette, sub-family A (ABC1), member 12 n=3 Tax=Nothobranchius TaxID=28779 RepID=A0A1A8PUY7_9TELE